MDTQITFEQIHNSLPNITEDEVERTLQEASSIDWWYSTNTSSEKAQTIVYDGDYLPSDLVDECFIDNQHTFVDPHPYENVDVAGNVYNRLVIFDAHAIHAAQDYFGHDIDIFKLYLFLGPIV